MKLIDPSFEILSSTNVEFVTNQLKLIELAGRNCYKSEDKICDGSHDKMIGMLRMKKHLSVLEHGNMTVRMIGSRGFSHQLVRHRIAAYSQESQRYCSYNKDKFDKQITFIKPIGFDDWDTITKEVLLASLEESQTNYLELISLGLKAEDARNVLPNACKTEIVVTMNLRSWMHFFSMRCDKHAQDEIRFLAKGILKEFHELMPVIFKDLYEEYITEE